MKSNIFKSAGQFCLLTFLLLTFHVNGQLVVNSTVTPEEMVANILGPGVTASNIVRTCDPEGSGAFSNGASTNIGIDEGILLTSGNINDAPGPNLSGSTSYNSSGTGDADLEALIPPFTTEDACVLEFDFIATGDEITVQYVFASEEYNEYVCSNFNDVFAFFVSGNNPAGGVYLNENVALVPGDSEPVAINNVNIGVPGVNGSIDNCGSLDNSAFFIDNSMIDSTSTIEYDGFTVSLFATVNITPGETYHFKFAIADASDGSFDSGVFLKAESFSIFTCDAGSLSLQVPAEICTDDDVEDIVEVFTSSILPNDTYVYVLTDDIGDILAIQASNLINVEAYPDGTYFIYGVSYDGGIPIGLEVGENISDISNPDGCIEISNPLTIILTDCFDCPDLMADIGDPCDDGDPSTLNDTVTPNCTCEGVSDCPPPVNDNADGALLNTPDRIWGVPGWDTFEVGCATLSAQACGSGTPTSDSWYMFVAQAVNQGILARANPDDPNAANVDMAVEIFDADLMPLSGTTGGACIESRSCFNNVGAGEIERCVPGGLTVGETYYYRVYDAAGAPTGNSLLVDTKVKMYASHTIVSGCDEDDVVDALSWTIEAPNNLYNIPPVPVFNVRMVMLDLGGNVVATTPNHNPALPGGLDFEFAEFMPAVGDGPYTIHAQNEVKMHANGCVSSYWSELGPGCLLDLSEGLVDPGQVGLNGLAENINLAVYPNPNNGDEVYVSLKNLSDESQTITLELFDVYGKRVIGDQYASSGTLFNRIVTFDDHLSNGIYLLQISIEGQTLTQKLSIE